MTFRGAGLLLARHQASTHAIRPTLKQARERLHVRDRGWVRTGGKGLAQAWKSGNLASGPGSAPGAGDLGLLPGHLLASLPPTYERRRMQPWTPFWGPPPQPVSVRRGQGDGKSLEGGAVWAVGGPAESSDSQWEGL